MPRDWESRIDEAVEAGDHRSQYPASAGSVDPLLFDVRLESTFECTIRVEAMTAHEASGRAKVIALETGLLKGRVTVISTRVVKES
jgi:hypothetical protein